MNRHSWREKAALLLCALGSAYLLTHQSPLLPDPSSLSQRTPVSVAPPHPTPLPHHSRRATIHIRGQDASAQQEGALNPLDQYVAHLKFLESRVNADHVTLNLYRNPSSGRTLIVKSEASHFLEAFSADRWIVKFKEGVPRSEIEEELSKINLRFSAYLSEADGIALITQGGSPSLLKSQQARARLANLSIAERVDSDFYVFAN